MKTYVISYSEYNDDPAYMEMFKGTWKDLLIELHGLDKNHPKAHLDEDELLEQLEEASGDGMPQIQIFCVEDNKQVF